jgi:aspartyl-tRNA(Asn)/glutamyl-tRNA(Gln) amidotransferase subunit B
MAAQKRKPVIGLEIHAQLMTESKLFCGCAQDPDAPPNTRICPVCLGLPGSLPVLNRKAHLMAVQSAAALQAGIHSLSYFDRKNYFYPDLPKGYQITQQRIPLAKNGKLRLIESGSALIGINRIHLEEDAGKMIHTKDGRNRTISLIDFNRSGIPLIEIVTEPSIRSPDEAVSFLKQIRALLQYLSICDGNMQKGSLRCDANLSLKTPGGKQLGIKTEIKNLNSFRFLKRALEYEINRQTHLLEKGERPVLETRFWDENGRCTRALRGKEKLKEYRFFPDPDLPPLETPRACIRKAEEELPELPFPRWQRYRRSFHLAPEEAYTLVFNKDLGDYFEKVSQQTGLPEAAAHWITGEIMFHMKRSQHDIDAVPLPASHLTELITMVDKGRISLRAAKSRILPAMLAEKKGAEAITRKLGLEQISDSSRIKDFIKKVIQKYPEQTRQYQKGRKQVLGFFIGKVMEESRGRANPEKTKQLFKQALARYNNDSR